MTATTTDRYKTIIGKIGQFIARLIAGSTSIPKGVILCWNSSGYLVNGADTAGYKMAGVSDAAYDNSSGSNGAASVKFARRGLVKMGAESLTQAKEGEMFYVKDNQTVSQSVTNYIPFGKLVKYISATEGEFELCPEFSSTRTASVGTTELDSKQLKTLKFMYDFDDLGGAQGALTLTDEDGNAQTIPDNALVVGGYVEGVTSATSGGSATIMLGVTGNTNQFLAATAFDHGEFTAEAFTAVNADGAYKVSTADSVIATIATADLTAGKFYVFVQYYEGA